MGKLKMGCLGFVVIFMLLAIVGAFMVADDEVDNSISNKKTTATAEKKMQEFVCDVGGVGKVKGGMASNVGIAIYKVEERSAVGTQFYNKRAQGKFVIVSAVVANNQKDAITVDATSFKLLTSDGIEYSYSTEAQTALEMENDGEDSSFLKEINPGIVTSVQIPFDIPTNKNLVDLKLEAHGGFTGDRVLLPLVVQKAE